MPDISMCPDDACPSAYLCLRSEKSGTKPNGRRQSWANFGRAIGESACRAYWPMQLEDRERQARKQR